MNPSQSRPVIVRAFVVASAAGFSLANAGCHPSSQPQAPNNLVYSTNPAVFTRDVAITPDVPSSIGGAVTSYAVDPALPAGLNLDIPSGIISGTPTAITPATEYVVTASNSEGSTRATLSITVNDVACRDLAYSTNPAVYTRGTAITPNVPSSSGGAVVSYAAVPALPPGLSLSTFTGVISGTPTVVEAMTSYTVTATNSGGSTTASLTITIRDMPPTDLAYSVNRPVYTKGITITPNTPSSTGGAVVSYAVVPALPAGLSLNTSTGFITGTPTTVAATAIYTVTATNSGGSATTGLFITVNDLPPSNLTYSANPAVYTKGTAITPNTPSSAGGAVVSYSVAPALPVGLSLNTGTGVISGTPTTVTATASYVVTATNSGGSATVSLSITVNDLLPRHYVYVTNLNKNDVSAYAIGSNPPGSLTVVSGSPFSAGTEARAVTADPKGKYLYVANYGSGDVSAYTINASDGSLSAVAGSPFAAGQGAAAVAVDLTGTFVYVANFQGNTVSAYTINTSTPGALTPIAGSPFSAGGDPEHIAMDPVGTYIYFANSNGSDVSAYAISSSTPGVLSPVSGSPFNAGTNPQGISIDPTGKYLYVANYGFSSAAGSVSAYTISTGTGALAPVAGSPFAAGVGPLGVAVDPTGQFVYVSNSSDNTVSVYAISSSTPGALLPVSGSPFATESGPTEVAVDPTGQFVYVVGDVGVCAYTISASTPGALVPVAGSPFGTGGFGIWIATVTGP
jgi:6-phosphogluconolactonase (cycloisomerase 2 family)